MSTSSRTVQGFVGLLALGFAGEARGQALEAFVEGAATRSAEVREAEAVVRQRAAERTQSLGRLLPSLGARAGYTRNQFEVAVTLPSMGGGAGQVATITPNDQLDASLTLDVPLFDFAAWRRLEASREGEVAARARAAVAADDGRRRAARQWFLWVGASALVAASREAVAVAERAEARAQARLDAGSGSAIDRQRATADAARARQALADAELSVATAARSLESVSGVPAERPPEAFADDLRDEAPLATWEARVPTHPAVRAAVAESRVGEVQARASWAALVPTLQGSATQRWTNAAGFGPSAAWAAGVSVSWRFDLSAVAVAQAADAAADAGRFRLERVMRDARDDVHTAWSQVQAGVTRARAARAELSAAEAAASTARERATTGTGTELEARLAERDAFNARVARVQADADLGYARALLRLAAAMPVGGAR